MRISVKLLIAFLLTFQVALVQAEKSSASLFFVNGILTDINAAAKAKQEIAGQLEAEGTPVLTGILYNHSLSLEQGDRGYADVVESLYQTAMTHTERSDQAARWAGGVISSSNSMLADAPDGFKAYSREWMFSVARWLAKDTIPSKYRNNLADIANEARAQLENSCSAYFVGHSQGSLFVRDILTNLTQANLITSRSTRALYVAPADSATPSPYGSTYFKLKNDILSQLGIGLGWNIESMFQGGEGGVEQSMAERSAGWDPISHSFLGTYFRTDLTLIEPLAWDAYRRLQKQILSQMVSDIQALESNCDYWGHTAEDGTVYAATHPALLQDFFFCLQSGSYEQRDGQWRHVPAEAGTGLTRRGCLSGWTTVPPDEQWKSPLTRSCVIVNESLAECDYRLVLPLLGWNYQNILIEIWNDFQRVDASLNCSQQGFIAISPTGESRCLSWEGMLAEPYFREEST